MKQKINELEIEIFADGANLTDISRLAKISIIKGFTTNPTLMRKSGITDYAEFAQKALQEISGKPISFEVFAEDSKDMINQALKIASWGHNVNVKIPITNSQNRSTRDVIRILSSEGVKLNITAIMTLQQVQLVTEVLDDATDSYISIFAGRIADTGTDPLPIISKSLEIVRTKPNIRIIWASPRELLNIFQANEIGCHIITATTDILSKLELVGKDLELYSLETVQMFQRDAKSSGYRIE